MTVHKYNVFWAYLLSVFELQFTNTGIQQMAL